VDAGVHVLVAVQDVTVDEIVTYSIAAMGVDGRHTHQRVCLSYYPPTAGTQQRWALTEAGTVHKSRYIILAALYRHWKYGGSIHCHARTTELRTGSFICVDVPPPFQHKPIQRDLTLEHLKTYSRHISTTAKITFEAARSWIGREPSLELLKPTEVNCFFCKGPLISTLHHVKLLTLYGERKIKSEKRRCPCCQFKFRHTDVSSGIIMHGQNAYYVALMVQLDIMLKRQGNFALFWKVEHLYHHSTYLLLTCLHRVYKKPIL